MSRTRSPTWWPGRCCLLGLGGCGRRACDLRPAERGWAAPRARGCCPRSRLEHACCSIMIYTTVRPGGCDCKGRGTVSGTGHWPRGALGIPGGVQLGQGRSWAKLCLQLRAGLRLMAREPCIASRSHQGPSQAEARGYSAPVPMRMVSPWLSPALCQGERNLPDVAGVPVLPGSWGRGTKSIS